MQFVPVSSSITVANMIGQSGTKRRGSSGRPPIRYEALATGLHTVGKRAAASGASVHMPRIGCGLAGGTWEHVGPLVEQMAREQGVVVWVYDVK